MVLNQSLSLVSQTPLLNCQQAIEVFEQGRFAGAVLTDYGDAIAGSDVQVDFCKSGLAIGIAVREIAKLIEDRSVLLQMKVSCKLMHQKPPVARRSANTRPRPSPSQTIACSQSDIEPRN